MLKQETAERQNIRLWVKSKMEISKKDWAVFREKIGQWQEAYMGKLCEEYKAILESDTLASEKFRELDQRLKDDKRHPGVILQMRKSDMIHNLISLVNDGVITIEDLSGFSEDTVEFVRKFTLDI